MVQREPDPKLEDTKSLFLTFHETGVELQAGEGSGSAVSTDQLENLIEDCKTVFTCKKLSSEGEDYSSGSTYFIGPDGTIHTIYTIHTIHNKHTIHTKHTIYTKHTEHRKAKLRSGAAGSRAI